MHVGWLKIVNNLNVSNGHGMTKIYSEITGSVWKVEVQAGQAVQAGQTLLVVESMKMEIPVESPCAGTVQEILVSEGEAVSDGQWLLTLGLGA